ncbi:hypothetical protein AMTRI_Chr06g170880 [Amborella trichopoda]|uniref:MHF histone-fold complex subunit 1 n=1 Tax=Amborella trichopoda TaxID=13333 RepID=UPI0005D3FF1B|nr:MHF histone-fold complex subunit 1 [Amborella trichopoda]XP_020523096.1 MHF histone-fold complex subunit 1 [Amborella trichopoda]XP_020523097.1 MHF histone-fold complex subunit 1 [Amborella trichopoda]XP_020523098.1 MHF histone-fold complex subunit 1 [Amborella trichopoda]|eukprot:XP_011623522.1 MHF histone-fold complex subunit 1 [Amborella trichopoda]
MEGHSSDFEEDEGLSVLRDDGKTELLKNRVRLSVISIAETEAKKYGMEVSQPVMVCLAQLTFKFIEQLAKDMELFAHHRGRKLVDVADVIICAHRNEDLAATLHSFSLELKGKEVQTEMKRKKAARKEDKIILD